jgi:hypothetical protein
MRVPDAAQRELRRSGAPLIRDLREGGVWNDPGSERIIPLRFMLRAPGIRRLLSAYGSEARA